MDLKWLRTFVIAAKYENFRQASEELFISQPSVTVHIKLLEEYLDVSLFDRNGRNVLLTEEGRRFLPKANILLENFEESIEDLKLFKQGVQRKLTLAISPLIAASIMPYILQQYIKENPTIKLDIQVIESKGILSAVLSGEVDCGLSRMEVFHQSVTCAPLYDDPVLLVSANDGMDPESSPPIDVEFLLSSNRILTHNHPEYWDDLLKKLSIKFSDLQTMIVSQVHVTKRFIEEGLGVSFLPESTVRRELMEGRLMEVHMHDFPLPIAKSYLVTKYQHTEGMQFFDFISKFKL
ncbi:LysR family transcriptional regulator [Peribacillus acanthi]|uniref:LysR family transcriptional regulator n=1 Tax=Peribacillus acanthi TaxID=2171554 RepID=UPI000D3E61FF|nr:LysR family transcriptional regulator [Peribacillus acanthi]